MKATATVRKGAAKCSSPPELPANQGFASLHVEAAGRTPRRLRSGSGSDQGAWPALTSTCAGSDTKLNGMGVIFDEPKYPVLDKAPGFWRTAGNFSVNDYTTWAVATVASYPFGYIAGKNAGVPRQSAAIAASIGAFAGFMLAYQGSSGRLMGFLPNDREVNATLRK